VQAEFLLEAAVSHQKGATDWIQRLVDDWHGKLQDTPRWQVLQDSALYSSDLRVRAAAIEINLAVRNLAKSDDAALGLIESAEKHAGNRPYAAWELGMLANRGVQKERIHELLSTWIHDQNQQTRFWAVEGLAHMGTDETIGNFLDVLRNDASPDVRERAGCSLAKSGMLTREQRMRAVPGLLELVDDATVDATTRGWVYQALREITDAYLPSEPAAWRNWYASHGTERIRQFHAEGPSVLGNN
jgi:hypothetical protein